MSSEAPDGRILGTGKMIMVPEGFDAVLVPSGHRGFLILSEPEAQLFEKAWAEFRKSRLQTCEWCGIEFPGRGDARFCSAAHRMAAFRKGSKAHELEMLERRAGVVTEATKAEVKAEAAQFVTSHAFDPDLPVDQRIKFLTDAQIAELNLKMTQKPTPDFMTLLDEMQGVKRG